MLGENGIGAAPAAGPATKPFFRSAHKTGIWLFPYLEAAAAAPGPLLPRRSHKDGKNDTFCFLDRPQRNKPLLPTVHIVRLYILRPQPTLL